MAHGGSRPTTEDGESRGGHVRACDQCCPKQKVKWTEPPHTRRSTNHDGSIQPLAPGLAGKSAEGASIGGHSSADAANQDQGAVSNAGLAISRRLPFLLPRVCTRAKGATSACEGLGMKTSGLPGRARRSSWRWRGGRLPRLSVYVAQETGEEV